MPTATATLAKETFFSSKLPLKAGQKQSVQLSPIPTSALTSTTTAKQSRSAALRSLYNRAARAFVLRDIYLTHSLLRSAFDLLSPPSSGSDSLAELRRKWDVLRITFESTLYASPPSSSESLPESLRAILSESPHNLVTSIYNRSLSLFTPYADNAQKTILNAAYLPIQVLTTLIYSSIKLNAPDVGRLIIEDWLARREPHYSLDGQIVPELDDYVKVLDLYCLHILPRLELWDYAKEFLEYESEMPSLRREHLKTTLNNLHIQATASRQESKPVKPAVLQTATATSSSPRSYSPAPSSSSSSSSSLSTTSTHTVVPATPRNRSILSGLTNISQTSSSSSSIASDETATPRASHPITLPNGNAARKSSRPQSKSRTVSSSASSAYSARSAHLAHEVSPRPPSMYSLIRASLAQYLTSGRAVTFVLIFILVPLISFLLRMRRRKRMQIDLAALSGGTAVTVAAASSVSSNADSVRRRLQAAHGGIEGGLVRRAWNEIVRTVGDTVRMAGSGLV
ncbi:hypothetical protein CPB84DRAFT_1842588 [Gymnopilus junonius]|uniref:Uncharacterized protein n=1 Tax=Gymnopilus junonius TaxID=109634 RepID=A0A9P5NW44_GYMJU|nr:hypothetical protein CPB84DRAFT_1842588 [Gymnopilus junonius]